MTTANEYTTDTNDGIELEFHVNRYRTGSFEAKVAELLTKFPGLKFHRDADPLAGRTALDFAPDLPPMTILYRVVAPYPVYKFGDFTLAGIIKDKGGKRTVWVPEEGAFTREQVEGADFLRCDHCQTRRNRNSLLFFAKEGTDAMIQIGTTCAKDYLGVDVVAELGKFSRELRLGMGDPDEWGGSGGRAKHDDPTFDYSVPCAIIAVERNGYLSRKNSELRDEPSTADYLFAMFNPTPADLRDAKFVAARTEFFEVVRTRRDALIEEAGMYAVIVTAERDERWTEFRHNLAENLNQPSLGMAAFMGSDIVRRRAANRDGESKRLALPVSTKMADLGEFEITFIRREDGQYGTRFFHVAKMADGTTVMFRRSVNGLHVGDVIALRGKVKKHLKDATVIGYPKAKIIRSIIEG